MIKSLCNLFLYGYCIVFDQSEVFHSIQINIYCSVTKQRPQLFSFNCHKVWLKEKKIQKIFNSDPMVFDAWKKLNNWINNSPFEKLFAFTFTLMSDFDWKVQRIKKYSTYLNIFPHVIVDNNAHQNQFLLETLSYKNVTQRHFYFHSPAKCFILRRPYRP